MDRSCSGGNSRDGHRVLIHLAAAATATGGPALSGAARVSA